MTEMVRSRLVVLLLAAAASGATGSVQVSCAGKPLTHGEVRAATFGATSYDRSTRPNLAARRENISSGTGGSTTFAPPDDVYVSFQLNSLRNVDTKAQTFLIEIYLRVFWFDYRLAYDGSCTQPDAVASHSYDASYVSEIWTPDVFTNSEAEEGQVLKNSFWLAPNGRVWWTRKMFWTIKCSMDFTFMPFDTQRCELQLSGYLHVSSEINFQFPDGSDDFLGVEGPVRALCLAASGGAVDWQVTYFNGSRFESNDQNKAYGNTFILYDFHLARAQGYYETYQIIPMIITIIATWASFYINRDAQVSQAVGQSGPGRQL